MDIKSIVEEIQNSKRINKNDYFEAKYPEFAEKYEHLFSIVCARKLDIKQLDLMLRLVDKINADEVSQHEASCAIGSHLFNKYVKLK